MNLSSLLIGYRPVIDRDRRIMALEVRMAPREGQVARMSALHGLIADGRALQASTLILSAPEAEFDAGLLGVEPTPGLWLAVPASVAESPDMQPMLMQLHENGMGMVLQGLPSGQLPESLLPVFRLAFVSQRAERRGGMQVAAVPVDLRQRACRSIAVVHSDVTTVQEMDRAFEAGAYAVCGWMRPETQAKDDVVSSMDVTGVLQLLDMVNRDVDLREIEAVLRREPELALRMLRHLDSVSFGLTAPVQNFQHAVMALGYRGMARWLSLMLVSANPDPNLRPLMLASFRRGLVLERLRVREADSSVREQMFVLGVFSLLDQVLGQPFARLLDRIPVAQDVADALIHRRGPHVPMLELVEAIERGPSEALTALLARCGLGLDECNRAILQTMRVAAV